jgi:hypothetical protein
MAKNKGLTSIKNVTTWEGNTVFPRCYVFKNMEEKEMKKKDERKTKETKKKGNKKENKPQRRWFLTLWSDYMAMPKDYKPDFRFMFGDKLLYACYGREIGEESQEEHMHVYLHFKSHITYRLAGLKKAFEREGVLCNCQAVHAEDCKGSAESNRDYMLHTGAFEDKECELLYSGEFGDIQRTGRGNRGDLTVYEQQSYSIIEMIDDGATLEELIRAFPGHFFRSFRNISEIRRLLTGKQLEPDAMALNKIIESAKRSQEGMERTETEYKIRLRQAQKVARELQEIQRENKDLKQLKMDVLRLKAQVKALTI